MRAVRSCSSTFSRLSEPLKVFGASPIPTTSRITIEKHSCLFSTRSAPKAALHDDRAAAFRCLPSDVPPSAQGSRRYSAAPAKSLTDDTGASSKVTRTTTYSYVDDMPRQQRVDPQMREIFERAFPAVQQADDDVTKLQKSHALPDVDETNLSQDARVVYHSLQNLEASVWAAKLADNESAALTASDAAASDLARKFMNLEDAHTLGPRLIAFLTKYHGHLPGLSISEPSIKAQLVFSVVLKHLTAGGQAEATIVEPVARFYLQLSDRLDQATALEGDADKQLSLRWARSPIDTAFLALLRAASEISTSLDHLVLQQIGELAGRRGNEPLRAATQSLLDVPASPSAEARTSSIPAHDSQDSQVHVIERDKSAAQVSTRRKTRHAAVQPVPQTTASTASNVRWGLEIDEAYLLLIDAFVSFWLGGFLGAGFAATAASVHGFIPKQLLQASLLSPPQVLCRAVKALGNNFVDFLDVAASRQIVHWNGDRSAVRLDDTITRGIVNCREFKVTQLSKSAQVQAFAFMVTKIDSMKWHRGAGPSASSFQKSFPLGRRKDAYRILGVGDFAAYVALAERHGILRLEPLTRTKGSGATLVLQEDSLLVQYIRDNAELAFLPPANEDATEAAAEESAHLSDIPARESSQVKPVRKLRRSYLFADVEADLRTATARSEKLKEAFEGENVTIADDSRKVHTAPPLQWTEDLHHMLYDAILSVRDTPMRETKDGTNSVKSSAFRWLLGPALPKAFHVDYPDPDTVDRVLEVARDANLLRLENNSNGMSKIVIHVSPTLSRKRSKTLSAETFEALASCFRTGRGSRLAMRDIARLMPVKRSELYAQAGVGNLDEYLDAAVQADLVVRQRTSTMEPGVIVWRDTRSLFDTTAAWEAWQQGPFSPQVFDYNVAFQPLLDTCKLTCPFAGATSVRSGVVDAYFPEPRDHVLSLAGTRKLSDYLTAAAENEMIDLNVSDKGPDPGTLYIRLERKMVDVDGNARLYWLTPRSDSSLLEKGASPPDDAFNALRDAMNQAVQDPAGAYDGRLVNKTLTATRWLDYQRAGRQTFEGYLRAAEEAGVISRQFRIPRSLFDVDPSLWNVTKPAYMPREALAANLPVHKDLRRIAYKIYKGPRFVSEQYAQSVSL